MCFPSLQNRKWDNHTVVSKREVVDTSVSRGLGSVKIDCAVAAIEFPINFQIFPGLFGVGHTFMTVVHKCIIHRDVKFSDYLFTKQSRNCELMIYKRIIADCHRGNIDIIRHGYIYYIAGEINKPVEVPFKEPSRSGAEGN